MSTTFRAIFAFCALAVSTAPAGVVTDHGRLQVKGNQILDKNGEPFQVAGMSLYWSVWGGEKFYNRQVVDQLTTDWKSTVVRAAAAIEPVDAKVPANNGYLRNPTGITAAVKTVVDAAIANDIYVIIDWHADTANKEVAAATTFFTDMAKTYGDKPNVIFEIWNEPNSKGGSGRNGAETWADVKGYANQILPVIRQYSQNLVIVGTPTWSQDVDSAAKSPLVDTNVAYTLHFYACTHGHNLIKRADNARAKGIALFITEFGLSPADGGQRKSATNPTDNYRICTDSATFWLDWADQNKISWANWSMVTIDESSAALLPGASATGPWTDANLTQSGTWIRNRLRARPVTSVLPRNGSSASGMKRDGSLLVLPAGTVDALLLDPSGRAITSAFSERGSLRLPERGIYWVRWRDVQGWHASSVLAP